MNKKQREEVERAIEIEELRRAMGYSLKVVRALERLEAKLIVQEKFEELEETRKHLRECEALHIEALRNYQKALKEDN